MSSATKDKAIHILITVVSSLVAAGGGSYAINNDLLTRVAVAETKIAEIQSDGDKIIEKLEKLADKIDEGQIFIRDEVAPDITELKVDVATLKSRR